MTTSHDRISPTGKKPPLQLDSLQAASDTLTKNYHELLAMVDETTTDYPVDWPIYHEGFPNGVYGELHHEIGNTAGTLTSFLRRAPTMEDRLETFVKSIHDRIPPSYAVLEAFLKVMPTLKNIPADKCDAICSKAGRIEENLTAVQEALSDVTRQRVMAVNNR